MLKEKIFTIAIPTFNHHDQLLRQLEIIIPQLTDDVECLIIDNNSTIPVSTFLKEYKDIFDRVRIIQNDRNIGADANIFKCIVESKTDWVWTLSDNDFIKKGSIEKVKNVILENFDSVFVNFYSKNNDQIVTKGYKEFCDNACYWSSFAISYCAVNKKKIDSYYDFYALNLNTHQPQLLTVLKYLNENENETCFFTNLNIFEKLDCATWSKAAFIIDSLEIYNRIPAKNIIHFRNTLGRQIIKTHLFLLTIARTYEGLSFKNYLYLFKEILKNSPKHHLLINKPFLNCLICLISPKMYYFFRRLRISKLNDYSFTNASKSLKWNY